MNVLFQTAAKRRVDNLAPGDQFRIREDDIYPHTLISDSSPHLIVRPGKVYSLVRGTVVEHNSADIVYVLDVTRQP